MNVGAPRGIGGPTGGFTLAETLVGFLLTALLVQAGWTLFATYRKAGGRAWEVAEGLETVRTIAWLLGEEFGGSEPLRDWWPGSGDTISLRAYRGLAIVGGREAGGGVRVCFRGIRSPNPEKDSVLFLGEDGGWTAHGLARRVRGEPGCMGSGEGWEEVWEVDPVPKQAVFGRIYERGSYHFALGALRYRRGGGGRQPLTPGRISSGTIGGGVGPGDGLLWSIQLSHPGSRGDTLPWSGWIR